MFQTNEELKNLFKGFRDLPISDELRANELFEHHAMLVMGVIDDAITHIADVDYVISLCKRTGKTHNRFDGFSADLFWNMEGPFLHSMKVVLQDRYTEQMETIYKITVHWILGLLVEYGPAGSTLMINATTANGEVTAPAGVMNGDTATRTEEDKKESDERSNHEQLNASTDPSGPDENTPLNEPEGS